MPDDGSSLPGAATRLTAPGQPFAPFRFPAFRAIWTANFASSVGGTIQSVAAAWMMAELAHSHQLVAAVQAANTLPILLFAVFAGAIADNYDRRRVMLAAQIGMLVVSAFLALAAWEQWLGPGLLLALTFLIGTGAALNGPAWQASVRMQVPPQDLPQAISLNTIAFNLARSVGPALGGLLISVASAALAFALNTVSYLAMIVVLLRWKPEGHNPQRRPMLASIAVGLRFCAGSGPVRRVLLRALVFGAGAACHMALAASIVRDHLRGTGVDFGLMLGAFGIGSILAALWVSEARRRWGSETVVTAATLVFAVALLPLATTSSLAVAIWANLLAGAGWVSTLTSLNVAMQMRAPDEILGRCMAIYQAVMFGALTIGAWLFGLLADLIGLSNSIFAAAAFLILALLPLRRFAPMPTREEGRILR